PTQVPDHAPSRPLSDCEQRKQRESRVTGALAINIECNPDGSYKPIQCFGAATERHRRCACYTQEYDQIRAPSTQLKSCNCIVEHHEKSKPTSLQVGAEIPKCNLTSGYYEEMQCNEQQHWCVDKDHGTPLGEKRPGGCAVASSDTC
ncbi:unnamed protein product, partial [Ixodes hexagonus]